MLPEKLPRNKALVELEARSDGATDLAGDAGVCRTRCSVHATAALGDCQHLNTVCLIWVVPGSWRLASCTGFGTRRCGGSLLGGYQCFGKGGGQRRPERWLSCTRTRRHLLQTAQAQLAGNRPRSCC